MTKEEKELQQKLKHSLNSDCYFPLARDVRVNIISTCFKELLKVKKVHLPIFQRQYCWSDKVLKGYWNDLLKLTDKDKRRAPKHNIGKLFVFEGDNKILVIDGQQRITTTVILLTSMKYHLLNNIKVTFKNKDRINDMVRNINNILFNDTNNLCGNGLLKKGFNESTQESKMADRNMDDIILYEGIQLDFIRFLPTYLDRQSFYNTIIDHDGSKNAQRILICNSVLNNWLKTDTKSLLDKMHILLIIRGYYGCVDVADNNINIQIMNNGVGMEVDDDLDDCFDDDFDDEPREKQRLDENVVVRCKNYFDQEFKNITSLKKLQSIYDELLNNFYFVYLGIAQRFLDKGYHIYQWTFECNLAAAKIFQIKRPGVDQRPNELFKNYILSFYINSDEEIMHSMYMKWIGLMKLFNDLNKFDTFLVESVGTTGYYAYDKYQDLIKHCDKNYLQNAKESQYCDIIKRYLDDLINDGIKYLKNGN